MRILSIQSQVIFGHVGNSAVAFPLACLGHEVWAVPTAILANHAAYPDTAGRALAAKEVSDLLAGVERRGAFAACGLVLSGYLGTVATASVVADAVSRVRAANPGARFGCDPVFGDRGSGVYVDAGLPRAFAEVLMPVADILTPNLFELEVLSGAGDGRLDRAEAGVIVESARRCLARMRRGACVLVTSAAHRDLADDTEAMLAVTHAGAWRVETPRLIFATAPHGAGDLVAALFSAYLVETGDPKDALERSAACLYAVLEETARQDLAELAIMASKAQIENPGAHFVAHRVD